ncbi:MAG: taurine ABC transporter permease, partial [Alphaproteobacteria bacterium]|nr:taurine ABC transporter permease [Alphaproteobacteria bacterium]
RAFIDANPDVVRRFVAAAARAWRDTMETPADAIDSLLKRDPLLNRDQETERMRWMVAHNLRPRDEARKGLGDVDPKRLADGLAVVSQALELPTTPTVDSVFTDRFLPPLPDRTPKL